jgi:competence protein ComEC
VKVFGFWLGDIAFAAGAAFLVGVAAANLGLSLTAVFWWIAVSACGAVCMVRREGLWKLILLIATFLFFGILYFQIFQNAATARMNLVFNKKVDFSAVVSDEPQPSEKFMILSAEAQLPFAGHVTILAPPESVIAYGDLMNVYGKILPPNAPGGDPLVYLPAITVTGRHRASWLREKLIAVKTSALHAFEQLLPREEAGLLGGIAFGSKVDLGPDLKRALSRSGTTHLVAVSGYNITIVLYAVERALGRNLPRRAMLVVALAAVLIFVIMTGLQASAIRAAIMGCIVVFASEVGGTVDVRNALTLTAVSMTLFEPTLPVRNPGFQLSFLSLAGIVYLEAPLRRLFHLENDGVFGWKASAITTLSAQLAVLPILSVAFGGFSATAIGSNVMVLGTVPITMFFGFVLAGVASISNYLAFGIAQVAHLLLAYQIGAIRFWSDLAVPIPIPFGTWFVPPLYYGCLAWFIWKFREKRNANIRTRTNNANHTNPLVIDLPH